MAPMGITFPVASVKVGERLALARPDVKVALRRSAGASAVEFYSPLPTHTVALFEQNNLLAAAVHQAFYEHYPLTLSPDVIWTTIAQGLAYHVSENAEALRSKFVDFPEGKRDIVIERPEFAKGSPSNDWQGVIEEMSAKVAASIGEATADLIRNDFSTTTPVSRLCSQITLLDTVRSYFRLVLRGGCGVPEITLLGTPEDWQRVREKAAALARFDLDWWISELLPVLDQFVAASRGDVDTKFWQSVCNVSGGSGQSKPISGWIQCLFPYLMTGVTRLPPDSSSQRSFPYSFPRVSTAPTSAVARNEYLGGWRTSYEADRIDVRTLDSDLAYKVRGDGVELKHIPSGLSAAPFEYQDLRTHKKHSMKLVGGLFSISQDPETMALEPQFGWAVIEE